MLEETKTDFTDSFVAVTEFREALDAGTQDLAAAKEDLVRKLVSRCATPKSQADSLRRKLKISRPSMHPTQVQQLWEALQRRPEEVSAMFGDAPIDLLRQEIGAEKEKLDRLMGWSQQIQVLEMTSPNSFTATNTDQWRQWVNNYCSFLNLESGNVQGQVVNQSIYI